MLQAGGLGSDGRKDQPSTQVPVVHVHANPSLTTLVNRATNCFSKVGSEQPSHEDLVGSEVEQTSYEKRVGLVGREEYLPRGFLLLTFGKESVCVRERGV